VSNARIIFPYTIQNNNAELFNEEYFENNFPLAWNYLNENIELLRRRSLLGNNPKWYQCSGVLKA
jgi:hypothetical protein